LLALTPSIGLVWIRLVWIRLVWIRLVWIRLVWIGSLIQLVPPQFTQIDASGGRASLEVLQKIIEQKRRSVRIGIARGGIDPITQVTPMRDDIVTFSMTPTESNVIVIIVPGLSPSPTTATIASHAKVPPHLSPFPEPNTRLDVF
jgi:hypothetical protein